MSHPRVSFGIIVLNGEPFTRYSLRALYPFAYEIILVEGACRAAAGAATGDGHSTDATLEVLADFKTREDPENKALIVTIAGGQSLNLQATRNIIFYNIPFGIGYFVQVMGRIVREFSMFSTCYVHFVALEDTIDQYKYDYIKMHQGDFDLIFKNKVSENIKKKFDGFNAYILQRLRKQLLWKKDAA